MLPQFEDLERVRPRPWRALSVQTDSNYPEYLTVHASGSRSFLAGDWFYDVSTRDLSLFPGHGDYPELGQCFSPVGNVPAATLPIFWGCTTARFVGLRHLWQLPMYRAIPWGQLDMREILQIPEL